MFWSVSLLSGPQGSAYSRVVLVVVLHHALDVEQFVPQPATLFLLWLIVRRLQQRERQKEREGARERDTHLKFQHRPASIRLFHSVQRSSPASAPLTCYIPLPQPVETANKRRLHVRLLSLMIILPNTTSGSSFHSQISVSGSDLVFGRRVVQRVQLPAQFVELIVDVVHVGAQPLVLPKVGVKLPLVLVSLGIRCYHWVNTGGGGRQQIILNTLHTLAHTYTPAESCCKHQPTPWVAADWIGVDHKHPSWTKMTPGWYLWPNSVRVPACLRGLLFLLPHVCLLKHLSTYDSLPPRSCRSHSGSCHVIGHVTELTVTRIKECRSDPEGATTSKCNSTFLDKDNFICNPSGEICSVSPLPLFSVQLVARFSSGGVLSLVLGLVPLWVPPASLAPVGRGFASPADLIWRAGAGSLSVGEGFWGPAGGPLRVPEDTRSVSGIGSFIKRRGMLGFEEKVKSRCAHITRTWVKRTL